PCATLLATPCTAPFLGTAVSVALVAPLPLLWGTFLATRGGNGLMGHFWQGALRHPAGDALYRAVPRYRRVGGAGGAPAAAVG
ncbi:hypothetical protein C7D74_32465, partial [Klebsiella pneumoniae]